tara:strand:- start:1251 stop:1379 length:129 start_codon:yes stop_codon:yes gene_type:complete
MPNKKLRKIYFMGSLSKTSNDLKQNIRKKEPIAEIIGMDIPS